MCVYAWFFSLSISFMRLLKSQIQNCWFIMQCHENSNFKSFHPLYIQVKGFLLFSNWTTGLFYRTEFQAIDGHVHNNRKFIHLFIEHFEDFLLFWNRNCIQILEQNSFTFFSSSKKFLKMHFFNCWFFAEKKKDRK